MTVKEKEEAMRRKAQHDAAMHQYAKAMSSHVRLKAEAELKQLKEDMINSQRKLNGGSNQPLNLID